MRKQRVNRTVLARSKLNFKTDRFYGGDLHRAASSRVLPAERSSKRGGRA